MGKTLDILKGTEYTATVTRDENLTYTVTVKRPPRNGEVEMFHAVYGLVPTAPETVMEATLRGSATMRDLERLVEQGIESDAPSLVGFYTGNEEEEETND